MHIHYTEYFINIPAIFLIGEAVVVTTAGILGFGNFPKLGCGRRTEDKVFVMIFLHCEFVFTVVVDVCEREAISEKKSYSNFKKRLHYLCSFFYVHNKLII